MAAPPSPGDGAAGPDDDAAGADADATVADDEFAANNEAAARAARRHPAVPIGIAADATLYCCDCDYNYG